MGNGVDQPELMVADEMDGTTEDTESDVGSPPVADDGRCEEPAAHHQHQQGGSSKPKLRDIVESVPAPVAHMGSVLPPSSTTINMARRRYAEFLGVPTSQVSAETVARTTLGLSLIHI